jgi:hypothetical protein
MEKNIWNGAVRLGDDATGADDTGKAGRETSGWAEIGSKRIVAAGAV